ncbi:metal ABC transporter permease [candidate division KSB1 bacterium]
MIDFFTIEFMRNAIIASLLISTICSFLGIYIVLRRMVFMGAALAQISSLGVALAYLFDWNVLVMSFLVTFAGVLFLALVSNKNIPRDSFLGITYAAATGFAVITIAKSSQGDSDIFHLLFGSILSVTQKEILMLLIVFAVIGLFHWRFYKEILFVSFDSEMAVTLGVNTKLWEILFFLTVGIVIALSIRLAGVILTFSYLVMPAVAGLLIGRNLRIVIIAALVFGWIITFTGIAVSFSIDLPPSSSIVSAGAIVLILIYGILRIISISTKH